MGDEEGDQEYMTVDDVERQDVQNEMESSLSRKRSRAVNLILLFSVIMGVLLVGTVGRQQMNARSQSAFVQQVSRRGTLGKWILVSEKDKILYCAVPRAVPNAFDVLMQKAVGTEIADGFSNFTPLSRLPPAAIEEVLNDRSYFRFAFVRDPLSRTLSLYRDRVEQRETSSPEYISFMQEVLGRDVNTNGMQRPTFVDILRALREKQEVTGSESWTSSWNACAFEGIKYDYVAHAENLQRDSSAILNHLAPGMEINLSADELKRFAADVKRTVDSKDEEARTLVEQIYERDITSLPMI